MKTNLPPVYMPAPLAHKPVLIQMYGGPGSGKSTLAVEYFAKLKRAGRGDVEYVSEFAKDLVWSKRSYTMNDQFYLLAKQAHKYRVLRDHDVNLIISDTSLMLGSIYGKADWEGGLNKIVEHVYKDFDVKHIYVTRTKTYCTQGRTQSKKEALELDTKIKSLDIPFIFVSSLKKLEEALDKERKLDE